MTELKPCPFCGGAAKQDGEAFYTWIKCQCGIAIHGKINPHEGTHTFTQVWEGVIDDWNHRPIEDALRARIKEL